MHVPSTEARALLDDADFIDLHLDLDVPVRLYGYDPQLRHPTSTRPPRMFGHTDFPRLREAGFTGAVYDIATNPLRPARQRQAVTLSNLENAKQRLEHAGIAVARTANDYRAARARGQLAMWLSLQGGNALAFDPAALDGAAGRDLHRITLVHLTNSVLGCSNSPWGRDTGLTDAGRAFIARCNAQRILVDLAHASRRTFWEALDAHDRSLPPIVSHTGVCGVNPHWRNLDDDQLRAIADRGGVIGILYHSAFLEDVGPVGFTTRARIVDHLEHVIRTVGEEFAAIGTDYDGAIFPPSDLADVTDHPLLIQDMLDRGWSHERIRNILGRNYLRVVAQIRP